MIYLKYQILERETIENADQFGETYDVALIRVWPTIQLFDVDLVVLNDGVHIVEPWGVCEYPAIKNAACRAENSCEPIDVLVIM